MRHNKTIELPQKLFTILLLLNFLVFIIPINTGKCIAKQFTTSIPAEEEHSHSHGLETSKILHQYKIYNFSKEIFSLFSKETIAHHQLQMLPVDWLETFSPPPDIS